MTGAATTGALRDRLDGAPMSPAQIRAVALTMFLSALDGYDVLSATFAAPAISRDWGIGKVASGTLLSSGLAGTALGSFLPAPFADLLGRKPMILVSLALMTAGSLLSATALATIGLAVALILFGFIPASLPALIAAAGMLGFLIFGSSAGFYATLALAFDDSSRAAGSGFVIGRGRISSAVAPLAAGWLFAVGLDRGAVSMAFAGCALVAGVVLALHRNPEVQAA